MPYVPKLATTGDRWIALSEAIAQDIRSGALKAGDRLPGTRTLAQWIGLHRNTVVRAYADLAAQGWVAARPGGRTTVLDGLAAAPAPKRIASPLGFDLPPARLQARPQVDEDAPYRLVAGQPDLRTLPLALLGRSLRSALRGRGRTLVDYGEVRGLPSFRRALASWLSDRRSLACTEDDLLITHGAQQALFLTAQAVFRPGDRVAVEELGYAPAHDALRLAGVELVPVPVDDDGLVTDALPTDLAGLYLTPHHQYPTGAMLSAPRRRHLLTLAARNRWVILEDDYDHEFHWEGRARRPLLAEDEAGVVVYIGTFSKTFAPGLRIGWLIGPSAFLDRVAVLRRVTDRQGLAVIEAAMAELIQTGELHRHIRRMHRLYAERRTLVLERLAQHFPDLEVLAPPGGLAVWLRTADAHEWAENARAYGVFIADTAAFAHFDAPGPPGLRVGFAPHTVDELAIALDRLAVARPTGPS